MIWYIIVGITSLITILIIVSKIINRDKGIFALIAAGNIQGIKKRVQSNPNTLKDKKPNGENLVLAAIRLDKPGVLQYLEKQGISVNAGESILYSIKYKSPESFKYILKKNSETKSFDISKSYTLPFSDGGEYFPLALAAEQRDKSMFYTLLAAGAEINFKKELERIDAPIHFAVKERDLDMLRILIEKGAKLDTVDQAGLSPLHWAAVTGNEEMTLLLLKNGASQGFKGAIGKSPREYSIALDTFICVKHLHG